jgi:hypothetical protein
MSTNSNIEEINRKAQVYVILDKVPAYSASSWMGIEDVYRKKHPRKEIPSIHTMKHSEQLKWTYEVLKANNVNPKNGDVIWIGGDNYRNLGIHFWDAKNETIVPMETRRGDYGHVPKMFAVGKGEGEFSPRHWDGISNYNNLQPYWSSDKKRWFFPLEDGAESDNDYYLDSD